MTSPLDKIVVHSAMGADELLLARELMDTGIIALDDIGGSLFDVVFDGIYDALGNWLDGRDVTEEKYETPFGPAYVLREKPRVSRKRALGLLMPGSEFICSGRAVRGLER